MSYFLAVTLSHDSLAYLERIVNPPVIEFYEAPLVYLTSPRTEILTKEQAFAFDKLPVKISVTGAQVLYNTVTGRSELDVFAELEGERESLLDTVVDDPEFCIYFPWAVDPMRSMSSRHFTVNVINSLVGDQPMLTGVITPLPVPGPASYTYNASTLKVSPGTPKDDVFDYD